MAWKFNNPQSTSLGFTPSDYDPLTDGKNVYVMGTDGTVRVYSIWGPQNTDYAVPADDITQFEYDDINSTRNVPTLLYSIPFGSNGRILLTASNLLWFDGTTLKYAKIGTTTVNTVCTTSDATLINANSDFALAPSQGGRFVYYVGPSPTAQTGTGRQQLIQIDTWGPTYNNLGDIPDKMQTATRDLVINGNYLYVSSMGLGSVHRYVASTGAYNDTIFVNRDVRKLYTINGLVYVLSSDKGKVSGTKNTMVSTISDAGVVTHLPGIIGGEPVTGGTEIAGPISGTNNIIYLNANGGIQRTDISTGKTFYDNGAEDYKITMSSLATGIKHILYLPTQTWDYNTGTGQYTFSIPGYVVFITASTIYSVNSKMMLYWENNVTLNSYAAASAGLHRYKGS